MSDFFKHDSQFTTGKWISIGSPVIAELSANLGHDFILVDLEHTSISLATLENIARAVDSVSGDTRTIVRVPWNDHVIVKRVLDTGVDGVQAPMIDSGSQAESFVEATEYPPDGKRGIASTRATHYGFGFPEYIKNGGRSVLSIVQIESMRAVENSKEIANVNGIDALFIGPADLSASLGVFGEWDSKPLNGAMDIVLTAGQDSEIPVGTLATDPEQISERIDQGFDYLIINHDTSDLIESDRRAINHCLETVSEKGE
jgi:2-keto-3-deoxy-L-rhamnonate aldolase RhmA